MKQIWENLVIRSLAYFFTLSILGVHREFARGGMA